MKVDWRGVYPAATTQFRDDESIDFAATSAHVARMIDAGVHGMILCGTVGENMSMSVAEKLDVIRAGADAVAGRVPVLTGIAETTTREACRFAEAAGKAGAEGLMVLPPMVYKPDRRETILHFRSVARAAGLPIMVYNNPPAYSTDITPDMFAELADQPELVAIKESSENPRRITDITNICGSRYVLFGGVDDLVMECTILGAVGWVSGLVNAFPAENRRLWDLMMADQWDAARALYRWYTPLLHLDVHVKLVQYIKLAMAETGMGTEKTRAPRLPLVGDERERVLGIIRHAIATRPKWD